MTAGIALAALLALAVEAPPAPPSPAPARVLTLADAEAAARAHQPQLQAAAATTAAALARTGEARAALLPQVSANGSYQRATTNFVARPGSLPRQIGTGEAPLAVPGEESGTDALLAEALAARPEIAALADQVRAAELTAAALRGSYFPSFGVSTGATDAGVLVGNLTWNLSAALQVSVPIWNGGLTRAQVAEGEANLASARSQLALERLEVRLEIEQARLAVVAAKAALQASADALENAAEQLQLAEGRYETGVGSIIELGDAQVARTAAAEQRVQAESTLAQARAQLVKALGRS